ncbi:MAG: hypothetical protein DCF25_10170 [Leptolyngbya foveolarum]|uniref:RepB/MobA-like C-terminal domain-containing protein n=1 Tax=Leptolyngbya foveolarum TaxID=47253 RepID=A0A2W4UA63_9CYAN|nr:MAG: hypothetical protein DCF25_10170 [Leptolyngbya foveolarum]
MAEYESVQQAEAAAGNKAREISEAIFRLLQQRQKQAGERGIENEKTAPSYEPSKADEKLFQDFYQAYRDRGVDRETAKAAAADMTLGIGASESGMIQQAELQVAHKARLAEEYRATAQTAINPDSSLTEKQQAIARKQDLERSLGINGQPIESKVQTINQLDPKSRTRQPTVQVESAQASSSPEGEETLRQSYQDTLEKRGARRETAKTASQALVAGKGAADSPPIALAEREIERHQVIKDMYQGVYERNGVSLEVAAAAADQLARGKGANRSTEVEQAHDQAIANIVQAQQAKISPEPQPTIEKSDTNRSPEDRQASQPKIGDRTQQSPTPQSTPPKPVPKIETAHSNKAGQPQSKTVEKVDISAAQKTPDTLWQQYSPTEQGAKGPNVSNYGKDLKVRDQRFAYNALSAGANQTAVKTSILRNSSAAQANENSERYASQVISEVDRLLPVAERKPQAQPATAASQAQNSVEPTSEVSEKVSQVKQPSEQQQVNSAQPSPRESQQKVSQLATANTPSQAQASIGASAQTQQAPPARSPQEIYATFDASKGSGVFATISATNARANDLYIAQQALVAGHSRNDVESAISEHSPHAQSLDKGSKGHESYAKRTVGKAQQTLSGSSENSSETQVAKQPAKNHASEQRRDKPTTKRSSQNKSGKKSQRNKVKSRDQGQGIG